MNKQELKKGLTYISERTDQLRYSDKNKVEEWLHPLSTYYPLQEVKRGQPLSVATEEDIKAAFGDNEVKLDPNLTYAVLTNPSKHSSCIGLAMEYVPSPFTRYNADRGITKETASYVHVLGDGKFIVDPSYFIKSHQLPSVENIDSTEYLPEFLFDASSRGKKIFVKGSEDGILTVIPEEAYLSHNEIIQVGFVSDTFENKEDIGKGVASIELQIEGDSRGPIDHTQFEVRMGESNITIKKDDPFKVFALGCEEDSKFSFKLGYRKANDIDVDNNFNGFIALRRMDGKTAVLAYKQLDFSTSGITIYSEAEDRAFIEVSKYYDKNIDQIILSQKPLTSSTEASWTEVKEKLNEAIALIAKGIKDPNPSGTQAEISAFNISKEYLTLDTAYGEFEANEFGGQYEVYVSTEMARLFEVVHTECHGSYKNKGMAVLADIRNPKRQNIIGVYSSGNYDTPIQYGNPELFTHIGLLKIPEGSSLALKPGAEYYLNTCGSMTTVPQSYYNSVVKIGSAETTERFITTCDDTREYWDGELPLGYMKPTVRGNAEYGFLAMDGKTPHDTEGYEAFLKVMESSIPGQITYGEGKRTFILPKVVYGITYTDEEGNNNTEYAQVKAIVSGVYQKDTPHPFVRYEWKENDDTIKVEEKNGEKIVSLPNIDITSLVAGFGIIGNNTSFFNEGDIEVKVLIDCRKELGNTRKWIELHPGFKNFNNLEYYGYEWHVEKTIDNSEEYPVGKWEVIFENNINDIQNPEEALGPRIEKDPFQPPVSIAGMPLQIVIYRHDLWERQFDLQGVFQNLVSQDVISVASGNGTFEAVSGNAVKKYINKSVETKKLTVSDSAKYEVTDFELHTTPLAEDIIGNRVYGNTFIQTKNTSGNISFDDIVIAVNNGKIGYYKNIKNKLVEIDEETLRNFTGHLKPHDLLTKNVFDGHTSFNVADENDKGTMAGPHGIKNDGFEGNLHAVTLNTLQVGTPRASLAGLKSLESYKNARIPFIYTKSTATNTEDYRMILPRSLSIETASTGVGPTIAFNKEGNIEEVTVANTNTFEKKVIFSGAAKEFTHKYNVVDGTYNVYTPDSPEPAHLVGSSTIQLKALSTEFTDSHTNIEMLSKDAFLTEHVGGSEDTHKTDDLPIIQNALQATSIMPVAAFKYLNEATNVKRWFGIITERILEAKEKVSESTSGKVGFYDKNGTFDNSKFNDDLEYTFTKKEADSIKEYLNFVTNNNDKAQNILSTIGVLLEASKETQMRLLPNEASIYGADASTIPGERVSLDDKSPEYATNTPTHLGLNRLVKALCAEVFLDADPKDIVEGSGEGRPASYSRLDKVCKAIYGENTDVDPHDEKSGIDIPLNAEFGKTYPDEVKENERTDAYTETTSKVTFEDKSSKVQFNNDDWLATHEANTAKAEDVASGTTNDNFDGIHDTLNRIVTKLNKLTEEIHESDNINAPVNTLNRIRDNVETLLHEVYDSDYKDTKNGNPFFKSSLSRIDELEKKHFIGHFNLADNKNVGVGNSSTSVKEDLSSLEEKDFEVTKRQFNNKPLAVYSVTDEDTANNLKEIIVKVPETPKEIDTYATILDILIDYVAGTTDDILRHNNLSEEVLIEKRKSETLVKRIEELETALDKVTRRITKDTQLENLEEKVDSEHYSKFTDIDTFLKWIMTFLGISLDGNGNWVVPTVNNNIYNLLTGDTYSKPEDDVTSQNNLYGFLIDIADKLKHDDGWQSRLETLLGENYSPKDDSKLATRNLTIEMSQLNRLFYGTTKGEDSSATTAYSSSPNESVMSSESFNSSVISSLYGALFTMPNRYVPEGGNWKEGTNGLDDIKGINDVKYLLADKAISKDPELFDTKTGWSLPLSEALTRDQRNTFLSGTTGATRWNRLQAIEDQLLAIRKMAIGELGTEAADKSLTLNAEAFLNRNNRVSATSVNVGATPSCKEGIANLKREYSHITTIGGIEYDLKHDLTENTSKLRDSALGIAALSYNIAEKNYYNIATLNHMLFTRNDETEKCFYTQYTEYTEANDSKVSGIDTRLTTLENADKDDDEKIANLGTRAGIDPKTGKYVENPVEGTLLGDLKALEDLHNTLSEKVGNWSEDSHTPVCDSIEVLEETAISQGESIKANASDISLIKDVIGESYFPTAKEAMPEDIDQRLIKLEHTTEFTTAAKETLEAYGIAEVIVAKNTDNNYNIYLGIPQKSKLPPEAKEFISARVVSDDPAEDNLKKKYIKVVISSDDINKLFFKLTGKYYFEKLSIKTGTAPTELYREEFTYKYPGVFDTTAFRADFNSGSYTYMNEQKILVNSMDLSEAFKSADFPKVEILENTSRLTKAEADGYYEKLSKDTSDRVLRLSDVAKDDTKEKPTEFTLATTSQVSSAVHTGTTGLIASTEADRKYIPKAWAPDANEENSLVITADISNVLRTSDVEGTWTTGSSKLATTTYVNDQVATCIPTTDKYDPETDKDGLVTKEQMITILDDATHNRVLRASDIHGSTESGTSATASILTKSQADNLYVHSGDEFILAHVVDDTAKKE